MENKEQLNPSADENQAGEERLAGESAGEQQPTQQPKAESPKEEDKLATEQVADDQTGATSPTLAQSPDEALKETKAASEETPSKQPEQQPEKPSQTAENSTPAAGPPAEQKQEATAPTAEQPKEGQSEVKKEEDEPVKAASAADQATKAEDKHDDEQGEDDSDALAERYAVMGRDELVAAVEELVKHEDVNHIRKHIGFIKASYRKLLRDENMAAYEQRLRKDDSSEEAETLADKLTERFDAAFATYKEKKTAHDKALEKDMQDNLRAKEEILEELRALIDSEEELKKTYDHFNLLQERWRAVGPVPRGSKGTLWNNYHFLVEKFFDKVNINKELKDLDLKKNLETKTELCEKAEELLLEASITRSFQQLQKLHEAWKETGPVPKDKKDELWDRFKAATDKLNKRRQEHYDSLREEQNKNYAAKLVLSEQAEELIANLPETPRQWQQKTEAINELFKVWKTIGFAPKKVNNEVWNRFRSSLDTFFSSKKEFFKKYKDQQKENYNQKLNLCLQAEALKDSEDWRATTESLIALQKEWKQIGPVPAKFSDKIWKRFREACDAFFNRKSAHFANIGEKQDENLKKKQELIDRIKTHEYSDDNKENLDTLKDFQRQWMDIGHVPIKQKDNIQSEFRKAIDEQFDKLKLNKKAKTTLSFRSKIENLKGAPNAGNIIQKERNFLANKIKNLEGDIKVLENNIGFFASSKKADLLRAEFEEKIEKARNEISILREKIKILSEN